MLAMRCAGPVRGRVANGAARRAVPSLQAMGRPDMPPPATPPALATYRYRDVPSSPLSPPPAPTTRAAAGPADPGAPSRAAPAAAPAAMRFRVMRIGGDGACMFRAIAQGAQVASRGRPMPPESEATAAHNLRLAVVAELRKRREEIEPFLPGIAEDFEQYLRTMAHPMAWGGEPEMVMAVHVVGRPITVYHMQAGGLEPIVTYGEALLGVAQPISLLWSGAHYDLLLPAQEA